VSSSLTLGVKRGDSMAERYWITGVQIGMLKALIEQNDKHNALTTLENVEEQFIGRMPAPYKDYEIIIKKR